MKKQNRRKYKIVMSENYHGSENNVINWIFETRKKVNWTTKQEHSFIDWISHMFVRLTSSIFVHSSFLSASTIFFHLNLRTTERRWLNVTLKIRNKVQMKTIYVMLFSAKRQNKNICCFIGLDQSSFLVWNFSLNPSIWWVEKSIEGQLFRLNYKWFLSSIK